MASPNAWHTMWELRWNIELFKNYRRVETGRTKEFIQFNPIVSKMRKL